MKKNIFRALFPLIFLFFIVLIDMICFDSKFIIYSMENKQDFYLILCIIIIILICTACNIYSILSNKSNAIFRIICFAFLAFMCTAIIYLSYRSNELGYAFLYVLLIPFIIYDIYRTMIKNK